MHNEELLKWLLSDDTGISSKNICKFMLGHVGEDEYLMPPSDVGDRGRCIRMLKTKPEWIDRISEMEGLLGWSEQIDKMRDEGLNS